MPPSFGSFEIVDFYAELSRIEWLCFRPRQVSRRASKRKNEVVEQRSGRIDLDRQAALGEIDLDIVRAFRKTPADFLFMLAQQILDEFLPRVPGKVLPRIHKAEGRG
jgi:hypothetical protein